MNKTPSSDAEAVLSRPVCMLTCYVEHTASVSQQQVFICYGDGVLGNPPIKANWLVIVSQSRTLFLPFKHIQNGISYTALLNRSL